MSPGEGGIGGFLEEGLNGGQGSLETGYFEGETRAKSGKGQAGRALTSGQNANSAFLLRAAGTVESFNAKET